MNYAVVDAEGTYSQHDGATVWATFDDVHKAKAWAKRGNCQILAGCEEAKGSKLTQHKIKLLTEAGMWTRVS